MIFAKGDVAEYQGPVTGHGDSLIMSGDIVMVVEPNEDEDDGVTIILKSMGSRAVPAFCEPGDLEWLRNDR